MSNYVLVVGKQQKRAERGILGCDYSDESYTGNPPDRLSCPQIAPGPEQGETFKRTTCVMFLSDALSNKNLVPEKSKYYICCNCVPGIFLGRHRSRAYLL